MIEKEDNSQESKKNVKELPLTHQELEVEHPATIRDAEKIKYINVRCSSTPNLERFASEFLLMSRRTDPAMDLFKWLVKITISKEDHLSNQ